MAAAVSGPAAPGTGCVLPGKCLLPTVKVREVVVIATSVFKESNDGKRVSKEQ